MLPSSSELTYFIEVASTLNLSRAAERLGITQPSLSLAIQRLEHTLGAQVLVRNKRGVLLTQAGRQLLIHSRVLMQSWEQVRGKALSSVNEIQGSFAIGCHPSVGLYSLSGFLPDLMKKYPLLNITLKHDLSRKITEGVISSTIDIGIAVNPVRHPDLVIHQLCKDEVTLWTNGGDGPNLDYRSGSAILLCDPELVQSQFILKSLQKYHMTMGRVISSNSLEVISDLTLNGCGIGILPTRVAQNMGFKKLKKIEKAPVFSDEISLLFRLENKNVKAIQVLTKAIKSRFL